MSNSQKQKTIEMWYRAFKDYDDDVLLKAVDMYINTSSSGFFPSIGQMKNLIYEMVNGTADEAWDEVDVQLHGKGSYKSRFESLTPRAQEIVVSPNTLYDWAHLQPDGLNRVKSDFIKKFNCKKKRELNQNIQIGHEKNQLLNEKATESD